MQGSCWAPSITGGIFLLRGSLSCLVSSSSSSCSARAGVAVACCARPHSQGSSWKKSERGETEEETAEEEEVEVEEEEVEVVEGRLMVGSTSSPEISMEVSLVGAGPPLRALRDARC